MSTMEESESPSRKRQKVKDDNDGGVHASPLLINSIGIEATAEAPTVSSQDEEENGSPTLPTTSSLVVVKAEPENEPNETTTTKDSTPASDEGSGTKGRWQPQEHELFLKGLQQYGKDWKLVAAMIKTRTVLQVRTHAQKYFQKISKQQEQQQAASPTIQSTATTTAAVMSSNGMDIMDASEAFAQGEAEDSRMLELLKDEETPSEHIDVDAFCGVPGVVKGEDSGPNDNVKAEKEDPLGTPPMEEENVVAVSSAPVKDASNDSQMKQEEEVVEADMVDTSATTNEEANDNGNTEVAEAETTIAEAPSLTPNVAASKGKSRCEQVGGEEMGMCLVHPPETENGEEHPAVTILRQIDKELKKAQTKRNFENWIRKHQKQAEKDPENAVESCRMIQGGRMEIFLDAKDKSSDAFDQIIGTKLQERAKDIVLDYCRNQADQDPRLQTSKYQYENFSLLVSWNKKGNPAQAPHLDLVHPNYQFGVVLADDTQGTLFVPNQAEKLGDVATIDDLERLWTENPAFADPEFPTLPPNIKTAFSEDEGAKQLLRYFGNTLHPEKTLEQNMTSRKKLPVGTLASLPGSVVHAGPASSGVRAILFFSGTPEDTSAIDPYLPDSQYNGVTLMGHFVSILWRRDNIVTPERLFLLRRLVQYIEGTSAKEAWALFGDGQLKDWVKAIQEKKYTGKRKDAFIREQSLCLEMSYGNDPFSQAVRVFDVRKWKQISCDNLFTDWEGLELPVIVYRWGMRIIIRYLTEGAEDEYEGHRKEDRLQLTMHEGATGLFDGSNGTIVATEGEVIEIYKGRRKPKEEAKLPDKRTRATRSRKPAKAKKPRRNSNSGQYKYQCMSLEEAANRLKEASAGATTNETFHNQLQEKFEHPRTHDLFDLLADGQVHDRWKTCHAMGLAWPTHATFSKPVVELRSLGLLEYTEPGKFQLTGKAFPFGRPE